MKKVLISIASALMAACSFGQNDTHIISQNNTEFTQTIADKQIQLIDARTPDEFKSGHIPGAKNINVQASDFDQKIEQLDKNRPVAVYCRSGARSKMAANKLAAKGFKVYELKGGFMNWNGKSVR